MPNGRVCWCSCCESRREAIDLLLERWAREVSMRDAYITALEDDLADMEAEHEDALAGLRQADCPDPE